MTRLRFSRPPESLAEELREVAQNAAALADEIRRANRLPADFPAEDLLDFLQKLTMLPEGTAEGCNEPLRYARARLPNLRRTYILTDEQSKAHAADTAEAPPLTRGMLIDQRLSALIGSVATALDEYRRLAGDMTLEAADTAPGIAQDVERSENRHATQAAKDAETSLAKAGLELGKLAEPGSRRADDLRRQMRDTGNLLGLARFELRMPKAIPTWFRAMVDAIKDYPALLRKTAQAMKIGVDIARPLAEAWSHFSHEFKLLVLESIEKAAGGLIAVADRWAREQATASPPAEPEARPEPDQPPDDFDLDQVHEMIFQGKAPPERWRPWIQKLDFSDEKYQSLASLSPLQGLTALETLDLGNTQVTELSALHHLTNLRTIYVEKKRVAVLAVTLGREGVVRSWE